MNHVQIVRRVFTLCSIALLASVAGAAESDRLRVQRKDVFEFAAKPVVTREGDKVTISFAAKDYCDVTVAIEDANGRIIRHLVSGVLGTNPPPPLAKDSLKQTVVWDTKDDQGRYVKLPETCTIRVALGLKPQLERTLYWSAGKMSASGFCPAPEGVYVADGAGGDRGQVRLFDHSGVYIRTVYPPPASQVDSIDLARTAWPPDGLKTPTKFGLAKDGILVGGGSVMALADRMLVLTGTRVNRLPLGSDPLGVPLAGSSVGFPSPPGIDGNPFTYGPHSAAASPDGRWLYLTAYTYGYNRSGHGHRTWNRHVYRVNLTKADKPEVFAGDIGQPGSDDRHFSVPAAVACDAKGRVYVADHFNDRIQVFSPDGKYQTTIRAHKPSGLWIHPKSGEIWVGSQRRCDGYIYSPKSWDGTTGACKGTLRRLGPLEKPDEIASWPLPAGDSLDGMPVVTVDLYADPVRVWRAEGSVRLYDLAPGKMQLVRDFKQQAAAEVTKLVPPYHSSQRLYVNPVDGQLYVGERERGVILIKGLNSPVRIDPKTGRVTPIRFPFDSEDMAFDAEGRVYLRTVDQMARFDGVTWREVPFDYGDEADGISYQGLWGAKVVSAMCFPGGGNASSQLGGMNVSVRGNVAIHVCNPNPSIGPKPPSDRGLRATYGRPYQPAVFPGRAISTLLHVFDTRGKVLYDDALPGVGFAEGIAIDKDDSLYLMAVGISNYDGKPYPDPTTCSLIKLRPKSKILSSGPIALSPADRPKRPVDVASWRDAGDAWIERVEWVYGGVGLDTQGPGRGPCHCLGHSRFTLDYFARSFAPEIGRYDVVVVDSAGNTIMRIGRYGNVDDGVAIVRDGGPRTPNGLGGDEVGLFNPRFVATHTDRRLFIADPGNMCIRSIRLGYHAEEKVALKDVK